MTEQPRKAIFYSAIREKLNVLDSAQNNVIISQGNVSAQVMKLDTTKTLNSSTLTDLTAQKAEIEEVDITKAATELSSAYTALQASYTISQQILSNVSLLDYL